MIEEGDDWPSKNCRELAQPAEQNAAREPATLSASVVFRPLNSCTGKWWGLLPSSLHTNAQVFFAHPHDVCTFRICVSGPLSAFSH